MPDLYAPLKKNAVHFSYILILLNLFTACKNPAEPTPPVLETKIKTVTEGPYTLILTNNDGAVNLSIREKMVKTFFQVYPQLVNRFNPAAPTTVYFLSTLLTLEWPMLPAGPPFFLAPTT